MIYRLWNRRKREADLEPPPVGSRDRQFRGLFAGVPLIILLVTISVFALLMVLHSRFMGRVGECRAVYHSHPEMEVIAEQQPYFLQPYGSLTAELYSPDPPEQVREWISRSYAAIMREAVTSGNFSNIPEQSWTIVEAEGGGSRITLTCP
jgi:hypothetical protein